MRILHLEDSAGDALIIERRLHKEGIQAEFIPARSRDEFLRALDTGGFDVLIVDNGMPRLDARDATCLSKSRYADLPVIVCSGAARDSDVAACLAAGADDYVLKDHIWQLAAALRRATAARTASTVDDARHTAAMSRLVSVVQDLSLARGLDAIVEIVRHAARELTGADGATFVLRDGECCYYVDENAISPLWKGQRFPLQACISGWAMLNSQSALIPDIYEDARIPWDAYRPTFVRSLVTVPIRTHAPIGAIGNYWASHHECTANELMLLQALANTTAVAIENVQVYADLEHKVRIRTQELERTNQELEAFTSAVSHDLRAPLRAINAEVARTRIRPETAIDVDKVQDQTRHMSDLIDNLLRLSRFSRAELQLETVDITAIVQAAIQRQRATDPERDVEVIVDPCEPVIADRGLLSVLIENLVTNAWKYSSKQAHARIEFRSFVDERGRRVFCINDNGAGFDSRYADRLFKPFSRLHGANEFPGIGIGLATVQRIAERHGGKVWAESEVGAGARFFFTLGTVDS
ncbi:ATP-binding protein [Povalibacter sp.]|uniref:ATP-binding protein n=1 Tax=Povalibacter sp. TaxID=1962978 RepID=UPI002F41E4BE